MVRRLELNLNGHPESDKSDYKQGVFWFTQLRTCWFFSSLKKTNFLSGRNRRFNFCRTFSQASSLSGLGLPEPAQNQLKCFFLKRRFSAQLRLEWGHPKHQAAPARVSLPALHARQMPASRYTPHLQKSLRPLAKYDLQPS